MPKRVAMAISGAVSLGTYEAGCVFEIIRAFEQHNRSASDEDKILIDVMTGASAGGMTAALLTYSLLYSPDSLSDSKSYGGYQAWVKAVNIERLMQPDMTGKSLANVSLLSTDCVMSIANQLIIDDWHTSASTNWQGPHPAAAPTIHLGLAMANLNGVDYEVATFSAGTGNLGKGTFTQTRFQDRFTRTLTASKKNPQGNTQADFDPAQWQQIIVAAAGCGAFPIAFTPVALRRSHGGIDAYDYQNRNAVAFADTDFVYMDGGAFNNYPLGTAVKLSRQVDDTAEDFANRYFVYISPSPRETAADHAFSVDSQTPLSTLAGRMASAVFWQARFQEWMGADSVNQRVDQLDDTAAHLLDVLEQLAPQALADSRATFEQLAVALHAKAPAEFEEQRKRLRAAYAGDLSAEQQANDALVNAWIDGICVLELTGNLRNKELMRVYTVTSSDEELASDQLSAFMGFFSEQLREHDYLVGRYNGIRLIEQIINKREAGDDTQLPLNLDLSQLKSDAAAIKQSLKAIKQQARKSHGKDIADFTMQDMDRRQVEVFYNKIHALFSTTLKAQNLGRVKRTAAWLVLRGPLKEQLGLKESWWKRFWA
ncbi:patatin-like phospholipase family protein [Aestuariibacter halophilus]|uniref:Patatin-like phospholipase family protein n=1 Tax=Fluctibacter halophilus TaxID=226011 RepID=A0ABS8G3S9_9ALTE|nr:patatin-like phospholipase family protein [Aestuariibacter halophilus]MCC2615190.1 patatin-like phospholipase family protein [Aestuariibacter halophilus]